MSQMIFINLTVADLHCSMAFFEAIGFARDAKFIKQPAAFDGQVLQPM